MKTEPPCILQVALNTPLRTLFDYLPPADFPLKQLLPGMRLQVPFGRSTRTGVLIATSTESSVDPAKLKQARAVLDGTPLFNATHLSLLEWSSHYYHHPLGDVIATSLPTLVRQGKALHINGIKRWRCTSMGSTTSAASLSRAPKQQALLASLQDDSVGMSAEQLDELHLNWRGSARALLDKELIEVIETAASEAPLTPINSALELTTDQQAAVDSVSQHLDQFQVHLLEGVTGSGKTEVYFHIIEQVLLRQRQVLVLIPEISLSQQTIQRFQQRFHQPLAVMHSGLSDQERLQAWLRARSGIARIVIGTRSATWVPLPEPGLIVIDEEHDLSYKQQEGFRYSARDVAIVRAKKENIPVILGSATPSLESMFNVQQKQYSHLTLPERTGTRTMPQILLHNIRNERLDEGLSAALLKQLADNLQAQQQSLIFINRRGYSPLVMCHECGWTPTCKRCDRHLTYHKQAHHLRCHHCGAEQPFKSACDECCSEQIITIGSGTERVLERLQTQFPEAHIIRIDRDTTRRKGELDRLLKQAESGQAQILVGTQMLSKGHHFPNLTLVGILDADSRLYSADFRAAERLAQLILQVSGRAGRDEHPGRVLIQTHHPDHPLLLALQQHDYPRFISAELEERRQACLPPCTSLALLRAESSSLDETLRFLQDAKSRALPLLSTGVELLGPIPAPMEKRAGKYRGQLLLQATLRRDLQSLLRAWVPLLDSIASAKRTRWSLDVDPYEML